MTQGLSFSVISDPTLAAMARVRREVQTANRAAVKAAGQALQKDARSRAPVYQGDRRDVPKGRLRRSIRAGRVFNVAGKPTAAGVTVGPRGQRVRLYAGKEEAAEHYMSEAEAQTASAVAKIAAVAYAAAMERGAR